MAAHAIASLEQWLIIRLAVVGDHHIELAKMRFERGQHAFLFHVVAHEKLPDAEAIGGNAAHANQKGISAGTAG